MWGQLACVCEFFVVCVRVLLAMEREREYLALAIAMGRGVCRDVCNLAARAIYLWVGAGSPVAYGSAARAGQLLSTRLVPTTTTAGGA
jgi:hypothetical protein